ncbi:profilin [Boletus edulis BED1]|uniref:Profilin n=1 Tax=Boletus edulis BED1 TaxID=1328754 RepID=A0AAD4BZ63_BOLED|nr:profilin [Boletus edulis BED1]KAF8444020.1 profilin [Boletus edulis BED1]
MSWQAYVDTNLVGTGKIQRAAILGQKGGVWASSAGYKLSPDEQKAIVNAHNNVEATQASGVRLAGQKFFTLQANDRSVYGKKGADGCILVKTKQAILVAEYVAPIQAPEATPIVEGLADYLISLNY